MRNVKGKVALITGGSSGIGFGMAQAFLENDYGLDVTQVDESEAACTQPPGRVCRSDPEPGTPVEPGDDVTLFIQPGGASLPGPGWYAVAEGGVLFV